MTLALRLDIANVCIELLTSQEALYNSQKLFRYPQEVFKSGMLNSKFSLRKHQCFLADSNWSPRRVTTDSIVMDTRLECM